MEISTPYRMATHQNFIPKFGTRNYVQDMTVHANFWADRGAIPKYVKYNTFVTFYSYCPYLSRSSPQVKLWHLRTHLIAQTTCFRARMCLLRVRLTGDAIWGKYALKLPKKWA